MSYGRNQFTPTDLSTKRVLLELTDEELVKACSTSKDMQRVCSHQDLWEERTVKYFPEYVTIKPKELSWSVYYPLLTLLQPDNSTHHFLDKLAKYIVNYAKSKEDIYRSIKFLVNILADGILSKLFEQLIATYWEADIADIMLEFETLISKILMSSDSAGQIEAGVKLTEELIGGEYISQDLIEVVMRFAPLTHLDKLLNKMKKINPNSFLGTNVGLDLSKERLLIILTTIDELDYDLLLRLLRAKDYEKVDFLYPHVTPTEPSMFQIFIENTNWMDDEIYVALFYFSTRKILSFKGFLAGLDQRATLSSPPQEIHIRMLDIFELNKVFPTQDDMNRFKPLLEQYSESLGDPIYKIIKRNNLPLILN